MQQFLCDQCERPIPATPTAMHVTRIFDGPIEHGDAVDVDVCGATCLRRWLAVHYPETKPDWAAAHRLVDAARVSSLPVPATAAQRVTAAELEEVARLDALDDMVDAGILDDDDPEIEGEPVALSDNTRHLLFDQARRLGRTS